MSEECGISKEEWQSNVLPRLVIKGVLPSEEPNKDVSVNSDAPQDLAEKWRKLSDKYYQEAKKAEDTEVYTMAAATCKGMAFALAKVADELESALDSQPKGEWSTDPPTEPGWWWVKSGELVRIVQVRQGSLYASDHIVCPDLEGPYSACIPRRKGLFWYSQPVQMPPTGIRESPTSASTEASDLPQNESQVQHCAEDRRA